MSEQPQNTISTEVRIDSRETHASVDGTIFERETIEADSSNPIGDLLAGEGYVMAARSNWFVRGGPRLRETARSLVGLMNSLSTAVSADPELGATGVKVVYSELDRGLAGGPQEEALGVTFATKNPDATMAEIDLVANTIIANTNEHLHASGTDYFLPPQSGAPAYPEDE